jgi:hypothetical protein
MSWIGASSLCLPQKVAVVEPWHMRLHKRALHMPLLAIKAILIPYTSMWVPVE